MKEAAPPIATMRVLGVFLLVLGGASITANGTAVALSREMPMARANLAIAYGLAALAAGMLLWRRAPDAPRAYLLWCLTIALYAMTFPDLIAARAIPGLIAAALILAWGYRYVSQNVDHDP